MMKVNRMRLLNFVLAIFVMLAFVTNAEAANKKRILVFGDSNTFGWRTTEDGKYSRHPIDKTWAGVLEKSLGNKYEVVIEGLGGRTTNIDGPEVSGLGLLPGAGMNGKKYLPAMLASQTPLDLVIIMLGTNDMQQKYNRSAADVAAGIEELAVFTKEGKWQLRSNLPSPKVLVLSPPKVDIKKGEFLRGLFANALPKSEELPLILKPRMAELGINFFDVATVVPYGEDPDELHLSLKNHKDLGKALVKEVKEILK